MAIPQYRQNENVLDVKYTDNADTVGSTNTDVELTD